MYGLHFRTFHKFISLSRFGHKSRLNNKPISRIKDKTHLNNYRILHFCEKNTEMKQYGTILHGFVSYSYFKINKNRVLQK